MEKDLSISQGRGITNRSAGDLLHREPMSAAFTGCHTACRPAAYPIKAQASEMAAGVSQGLVPCMALAQCTGRPPRP